MKVVTVSLLLQIAYLSVGLQIDKEWLENAMIEASEEDNVVHLIDYTVEPAVPKGVSYGSDQIRVNMNLEMKSGRKARSSVVIVSLPKTPNHEKNINDSGIFRTSIEMYRKVIPLMESVMEDNLDFSEPLWFEAIDLKDYDQITLFSEESKGYKMKSKIDGLDLPHCELAVVSLAKLHSLSSLLGLRGQLPYGQIDQPLLLRNKNKIRNFYQVVLTRFAQSIRTKWGDEWSKAAEVIERKSKTITDDLLNIYQRNETAFNVLVHGSYFINNLYFTYGISDTYNSTHPIALKTGDYQLSFFNSPAFDLQFFLNTSPTPELMLTERQHLIDLYYNSLSHYLDRYNYTGIRLSQEAFDAEMKRTDLMGLVSAINQLSFLYLPPDDMPDVEKLVEEANQKKEVVVDGRGMFREKYVATLKMLMKRAIDEGILS